MMQQKISQFEKNISKDDAAKPDEHASIVKLKKTDQILRSRARVFVIS